MSSGNISNLEFLARTHVKIFKDILLSCSYAPFEEISQQDFKKRYQEIIRIEGISDGLKDLFNLYLLSKFFLKEKGKSPSWIKTFIADNIDVKKYLGLCLDDAKNGVWCTVPVIFTGNETAYIRVFILGLLDSKPVCSMVPEWTRMIMSNTLL